MIEKDIPTIPTNPSPTLDPLNQTPQAMQLLVSNLRKSFLERPITTRRAIFNTYLSNHGLGDSDSPREHWRPILRYALPYVCYMFKSGPFRDANVVFGLDPRKEQTWAKYQTAFFNFRQGKGRVARGEDGDGKGVWEMRENHLFTGKDVGTKVVCYSFVDIVDPMIRKVIDESLLREKFHVPPCTRTLRLMSRRMMGGIRRKRYCG
jgi:general transcription factor 3C polypeptide 5 (transcription factor C subunit 1)